MTSRVTRPEIEHLLHGAVRGAISSILHGELVTASCLSCVHFKEHEGELCKLYGQRPPARVIAYACPDYMDNQEVPF